VNEHRLTVSRSARYYTLGRPGREVWFVLHGYGHLAERFLTDCGVLDDGTRLIVAPEALSRFYVDRAHHIVGASWMTREDRRAEIDDYVRYLDAVYQDVVAAPATAAGWTGGAGPVHVLGFSQGAAAAARWLGLGAARAERLILWGGEVPPDLDLEDASLAARLARLRLTLVAGRQDDYITEKILERDGERLRLAGVPFAVVRFEGGHVMDETVLRELAGA
jgi:predicted esterase